MRDISERSMGRDPTRTKYVEPTSQSNVAQSYGANPNFDQASFTS